MEKTFIILKPDAMEKRLVGTIEAFMSRRPVVLVALQGENVVQRVRDLLGPTDSRKAPKGTIRGDFGTDMMVNVAHASDSVENARAELARFFRPEELFA
jgi:nucleoside-diphosphate kinase